MQSPVTHTASCAYTNFSSVSMEQCGLCLLEGALAVMTNWTVLTIVANIPEIQECVDEEKRKRNLV